MKINDVNKLVRNKLNEIRMLKERDLPDIVGTEAVNHYRESFVNEGFTDKTTNKWQDVKRRDQTSEWYGFSPEAAKHFSPTRATDKILTGESSELQNSIGYKKKGNIVSVGTDKPYAAVHQFGLPSKIFGKKAFKMTARPFIGKSAILEKNIYSKIERELKKIINK